MEPDDLMSNLKDIMDNAYKDMAKEREFHSYAILDSITNEWWGTDPTSLTGFEVYVIQHMGGVAETEDMARDGKTLLPNGVDPGDPDAQRAGVLRVMGSDTMDAMSIAVNEPGPWLATHCEHSPVAYCGHFQRQRTDGRIAFMATGSDISAVIHEETGSKKYYHLSYETGMTEDFYAKFTVGEAYVLQRIASWYTMLARWQKQMPTSWAIGFQEFMLYMARMEDDGLDDETKHLLAQRFTDNWKDGHFTPDIPMLLNFFGQSLIAAQCDGDKVKELVAQVIEMLREAGNHDQ